MPDRSVRSVEELGAAIRKRRRKMGWDQQYLAERVRVSRQWIVEIEAGKPRAEIGLLLSTLQALDLRIEVVPEEALSKSALKLIKLRRSYDDIDRDIDAILEGHRRKRR